MAALTVYRPSITGTVAPQVAAASGGDTVANDGKVRLRVTNSHGTNPRTVTVDSPATCNFGAAAHAAHDSITTIAAGVTREIGPFPVDRFSSTLAITYSDSAADITIVAVAAE